MTKNKPREFLTIDEKPRTPRKEYKHQVAIELLTQQVSNFELELKNKRRVIEEILSDKALNQQPVFFLGVKIRLLQIEIKRLNKSIKLLIKYNKPLKVDSYTLASSSAKI